MVLNDFQPCNVTISKWCAKKKIINVFNDLNINIGLRDASCKYFTNMFHKEKVLFLLVNTLA